MVSKASFWRNLLIVLPQLIPKRRGENMSAGLVIATAGARSSKVVAPPQIFRCAHSEPSELYHLATMYERAWSIPLPTDSLRAQIAHFPEGQIVGSIPNVSLPVSMINMMCVLFDPSSLVGFSSLAGYEKVTGNRTFDRHVSLSELRKGKFHPRIPLALCVSIVVDPDHQRSNYALETLNYAIDLATRNDLFAVPYSAPRGYGKVKRINPALSIDSYLNMTRPTSLAYSDHVKRTEQLNRSDHRLARPFRFQIPTIDGETYAYYQDLSPDSAGIDYIYPHAFDDFLMYESPRFEDDFGRRMTVEDMCTITGRTPFDLTMRMHINNGARYIRDKNGEVVAFANSRPDDPASFGYNVLLTYHYHPGLGQVFL